MANKSYKQLYEECQTELNKLRELTKGLTPEEVLALRAVAHGCNTNRDIQCVPDSLYLDKRGLTSYEENLIIVYKLIKRLEDNT